MSSFTSSNKPVVTRLYLSFSDDTMSFLNDLYCVVKKLALWIIPTLAAEVNLGYGTAKSLFKAVCGMVQFMYSAMLLQGNSLFHGTYILYTIYANSTEIALSNRHLIVLSICPLNHLTEKTSKQNQGYTFIAFQTYRHHKIITHTPRKANLSRQINSFEQLSCIWHITFSSKALQSCSFRHWNNRCSLSIYIISGFYGVFYRWSNELV